ncbi:MAG: enoyl-CoA hydratase/isomerase family protein [Pseudonocardia sp.]|nr:enoyl-CoA hydratase/isomerase family protein [Pseudonocardia sp.]
MGERVLLDIEDRVATLRLDNPPLNVIDTEMREALARTVGRLAVAEDVHAVVVTGSERAFAAGADVEGLAAMGFEEIWSWNRALQRTFTEVAALPMPVIAAIEGHALGGGLELALCADHRIAGDRASLAQPEVLLGILPGSGGTQRLARLVGPSRTKELLMTGRRVRPDEAAAIGLVDRVVPAGTALQEAQRFARELAAGPQFALQAIKLAVDKGSDGPLEVGLALERSLIAGLFATRDRDAGMRSFLQDGPGKARFGQPPPDASR